MSDNTTKGRHEFLYAFAELRKATISFCPSVRVEQLGPPMDGFS